MHFPRTIFREYDVRGLVGKELTPELAWVLGRAFGTAAWSRLGRTPRLAVGRDNRPSGEALAAGVRRGLVDTGALVVDVGMLPIAALGCAVTPLFCESDGTFPNHHPDPTVPANLADLQREVRRTGAELGIAFDGDGDRIGAVDETGEILFGDQLLVIFGRDAVRR